MPESWKTAKQSNKDNEGNGQDRDDQLAKDAHEDDGPRPLPLALTHSREMLRIQKNWVEMEISSQICLAKRLSILETIHRPVNEWYKKHISH